MAMKIRDVLANKQAYPDDAKVTIAGEEITFGELRRQDAESQGELAQRLQTRQNELDTQKANQDRAVTTLANVLENVSKVTGLTYDQLVKGEIPANLRDTVSRAAAATPNASGVPLAEDPLYKPLFDSEITPMRNDLKTVKQAFGQTILTYLNDRAEMKYLSFMTLAEKPKDFKMAFKDAMNTAVSKGYKDEVGAPDVTRVLNEAMGPVVQQHDADARYQAGIEEGRKLAQKDFVAQLGTPQGGTGGIHFEAAADGKPAKTPSIKEKLDEAFSDPAIAASLFGGFTGAVN